MTQNLDQIDDLGPDPDAFMVVGRRTPPPKHKGAGDPVIAARNKNNRRRGKRAERSFGDLVHARVMGTLGGHDLDGGHFHGEVKKTPGVPAYIRDGLRQLRACTKNVPHYLFIETGRQGQKLDRYVIIPFEDFEPRFGLGAYPPKETR